MKSVAAATALLLLSSLSSARAAEAFEVAPGREADLPKGKEADGIIGDFVLRNDRVTALISQNSNLRRANMSTFYGADGVTPGCLYDLTLRDVENDQIVYFGPDGQRGQVSWVRVMPGSKDKKAAVETVITAAKSGGLFKRHEYRIHDGEQGIWVITTLRNEGTGPVKVSTKDAWTKFNESGTRGGILWGDAIDPADKAGYAVGAVPLKGTQAVKEGMELAPKQEITWARFLAVGHSPAEAWGIVESMRDAKTGVASVSIADPAGKPIPTASVVFHSEAGDITAYPDGQGTLGVYLPEGHHKFTVRDLGRPDVEKEVTVTSGGTAKVRIEMESASRIAFQITGADGAPIPCKAQILGVDGTSPVNLGPVMRAHGCKDQYHSENGHFSVQVPAGKYRIVVTHGIEFGHHEEEIVVAQGMESAVQASLKRVVDTKGWVSTDFHNHSTPSGDNVCGTADRIINIAAEQIEFTPTTEHNRIYDWRPTIEKLGLAKEIQTVVGMELTGSAAHLNCFPLTVEPFRQDNGAPVWNADPRISALTLRGWQGERDDRWVQINHPDIQFVFNDRDLNGAADGGFSGIERMVDGMETENFIGNGILADAPWRLSKTKGALATRVDYVRQFIWLQLLNKGYRITPIAVADAHTVHGNGVGGWRMYLPSKTDEPAMIDWSGDLAKEAKAGHIMLTTGPFLEVGTADGKRPGDEIVARGGVELHVRVQCTDWQDIDRVQVLVNGRKEPTLNFTRKTHPQMFHDDVVKFDETITVPLKEDAHLIVVATHESMTLEKGYGTSDQAKLHPMAYHTPIYVDVDDDGFKANGDTLGFDIPVAKMTPDAVREKLEKPTDAKKEGAASGS